MVNTVAGPEGKDGVPKDLVGIVKWLFTSLQFGWEKVHI